MKLQGKITKERLYKVSEGHHKTPRVLIVVADERVARIFKKTDNHLECIGEALPTHGTGHHKLKPHQKLTQNEAKNFTRDLCEWLEDAVKNDSFDRMILAADPKTLGAIRPRLHQSVHDRVAAEINKDLTKMNEVALQEELKKIVWF